jgi:hypothetical protein
MSVRRIRIAGEFLNSFPFIEARFNAKNTTMTTGFEKRRRHMYTTEEIEMATLAALFQLKSDISAKDAVAKASAMLEEASKFIKGKPKEPNAFGGS